MSVEDVVLVSTVREQIRGCAIQVDAAEIPLRVLEVEQSVALGGSKIPDRLRFPPPFLKSEAPSPVYVRGPHESDDECSVSQVSVRFWRACKDTGTDNGFADGGRGTGRYLRETRSGPTARSLYRRQRSYDSTSEGEGFSPLESFFSRGHTKAVQWMCQMKDMSAQAQLRATQQSGARRAGSATTLESSGVGKDDDEDDVPELLAPEDDGPVDETGVDPQDIELIMSQTNCSRATAVRVLNECSGDLINASVSSFIGICDLTSDFLFSPLVIAACE